MIIIYDKMMLCITWCDDSYNNIKYPLLDYTQKIANMWKAWYGKKKDNSIIFSAWIKNLYENFHSCLLFIHIIMMMFCLIAHEKAYYEYVYPSLFTSNFRLFFARDWIFSGASSWICCLTLIGALLLGKWHLWWKVT